MSSNELLIDDDDDDDDSLFAQPPPMDDCLVCFLRLPSNGQRMYQSCCGKTICIGCIHAVKERTKPGKRPLCPFCRTPNARTNPEAMERLNKRAR